MHKAAALIALASIAPVAQAVEVYRCIVDHTTRYQEKPCGGMVIHVETAPTGIGGLRTSEVNAYLDAVERDVYRIGPHQSRQLETVNGHLTILRQIVD
ncbi:MAG: hypothetical protein U1F59_00895 [Candidatus Competibacteraceae bacterium]